MKKPSNLRIVQLLSVLIYGKSDDKLKIGEMLQSLQGQLNNLNRLDIDAHFLIDNEGKKTTDELKKELIGKSQGIYYTFTPENYEIDRRYVNKLLRLIEVDKLSDEELENNGIFSKTTNK